MDLVVYICSIFMWILCPALIGLILLQGAAGDISSSFGGGGQLDASLGVGAHRKMAQVTGGLAFVFFVMVLILAYPHRDGFQNVKHAPGTPAQQQPVPPGKADAPKVEAKSEAPKVEAPKADAPKVEAPKAEAPKADAPKIEAKPEAPKADAPKVEAPKADAPKVEAKPEAPKAEAKPEAAPAPAVVPEAAKPAVPAATSTPAVVPSEPAKP